MTFKLNRQILGILSCIILGIGCSTKKDRDVKRLREVHKQKLTLWSKLPEPFYNRMPDSMRKWIPFFRKIWIDDQRYRGIGYNPKKSEIVEQQKLDSQNLRLVISYLLLQGWPTTKESGYIGSRALGMTIQHSPLHIQEYFYDDLVKAYRQDKLLAEQLSLLEDRINMRRNRWQNYGTQMVQYNGKRILFPIYEVDSVDIRRQRLGLKMSIKEYVKMLQSDWDIVEYKKMLPEMIRVYKVTDSKPLSILDR